MLKLLEYFLKRDLNFVVRLNTRGNSRHVIVEDKSLDVKAAAATINRRVIYNKKCRFGNLCCFRKYIQSSIGWSSQDEGRKKWGDAKS